MLSFMFDSTVVLRTKLFVTQAPLGPSASHIRIGTARREASCACVLLVIYKPNVNSYYSLLLQTGGQYFAEEQNHLGVAPLYRGVRSILL